jgi:hypothetical protein
MVICCETDSVMYTWNLCSAFSFMAVTNGPLKLGAWHFVWGQIKSMRINSMKYWLHRSYRHGGVTVSRIWLAWRRLVKWRRMIWAGHVARTREEEECMHIRWNWLELECTRLILPLLYGYETWSLTLRWNVDWGCLRMGWWGRYLDQEGWGDWRMEKIAYRGACWFVLFAEYN